MQQCSTGSPPTLSLFVEDHAGHWSEHGRLPLGQSGVA
jgi:hypothetical protein